MQVDVNCHPITVSQAKNGLKMTDRVPVDAGRIQPAYNFSAISKGLLN
jgi:hypothetical protein